MVTKARWLCRCWVAGLLIVAGCATERPTARSTTPGASPDFSAAAGPRLVAVDTATCRKIVRDDATPETLRAAATRNLEYLMRQPLDRTFTIADRSVGTLDLQSISQRVAEHAGEEWNDLCDHLRLYRVQMSEPLLVTGYYQPELDASRKKTSRFSHPIYRTPDDLVDVELREICPECPPKTVQGRVRDGRLTRYYTRAEIDAGALDGRGQELAWLDDPVEAFFLHVQGSALLRLEDGVLLQISYSSSNGYPYTSIGRTLIEQGKLTPDSLSLQGLKNYLRNHPNEQSSLMAANQRYVFFRGVVSGPIGSCGVPLTAGRSVAVDPAVYAHGALGFLQIQERAGASTAQRPYARLVMTQDAGNAVSGPSRLDVYWGSGAIAEGIAGDMRNAGELYIFLLN